MLFYFQYLFQCDQILYTIVPVTGKEELEKAYVENSEGVWITCFYQSVPKLLALNPSLIKIDSG